MDIDTDTEMEETYIIESPISLSQRSPTVASGGVHGLLDRDFQPAIDLPSAGGDMDAESPILDDHTRNSSHPQMKFLQTPSSSLTLSDPAEKPTKLPASLRNTKAFIQLVQVLADQLTFYKIPAAFACTNRNATGKLRDKGSQKTLLRQLYHGCYLRVNSVH